MPFYPISFHPVLFDRFVQVSDKDYMTKKPGAILPNAILFNNPRAFMLNKRSGNLTIG